VIRRAVTRFPSTGISGARAAGRAATAVERLAKMIDENF
jgi:hypothetical protein